MARKGEIGDVAPEEQVLRLQEELQRERKAGRVKEHELVELRRTMNENARRNAFVITSLQNSELRLSDKVGRYAQRISSLARHVRSLQGRLAQKHTDTAAIDSTIHEEPLDGTAAPVEDAHKVVEPILLGEDSSPAVEERVIALERDCEALRKRNAELEGERETFAASQVEMEKKVNRLKAQLHQGNNRRSSIVTQLQSNEAMLMSSLDDLKDERKELRSRLDETVAELSKERETNRTLEIALEEERASLVELTQQVEGAQEAVVRLQEEVVKERAAKNAVLEQHKRESALLAAVQGELLAERDAHKHSRHQLAQERAAHAETLKQKEGASASEKALVQEKTAHAQTRNELDNALQQLLQTQAVLEEERRLRANAETEAKATKAELIEEKSRSTNKEELDAAAVKEEREEDTSLEAPTRPRQLSEEPAGAGSSHLEEHQVAMRAMEEQVVHLKARVRSLEEENAALAERLRAENESMEKVLNDSVSVEDTASSRVAQLEAMLEAANEQLEDLKTVLNGVRVREQEATEALEHLRLTARDETSTQAERTADMKAQIRALTAQLAQVATIAPPSPAERDSPPTHSTVDTDRQSLVREHHEQMESLHREFMKQREQLREANEILTAKVKEYHSTIVSLQQNLRVQKEEHGRISSSLQSNNARLSEQLADYRKRMTAAAETASRLKAIQQQVPTLQRALSAQEEKYRALEAAVKLRDTQYREHIREQGLTIRDLRAKVKEMENACAAQESARASLAQQLADVKNALRKSNLVAEELSASRQELVEAAEQRASDMRTIGSLTAQVEQSSEELTRALQRAAEHEQEALFALQVEHEKDVAVLKSELEKQQAEFLADSNTLKEQVELTHAERTAALAAAEKQQAEIIAVKASHAKLEGELASLRQESLQDSAFTDLQVSLARHVQLLDSSKVENEHLQSQVKRLTASVRKLEEEGAELKQRAAQEKKGYEEGLSRLYERQQAELRAAQQMMQQRDQMIARLKTQVEESVTMKQQYEAEIQKLTGEAQRALDALVEERTLFEAKLRDAGAALAEAKSVGDEKDRELMERLRKAQAFKEESERSLKMKEAEARQVLEDSVEQLQSRIVVLEEKCAAEAKARHELEKTCSELSKSSSARSVEVTGTSPTDVYASADCGMASAPLVSPVPMVISDKHAESQLERLAREREEVDEKLRILDEEKTKLKQERRQQQSEIQELNLLMGETERRHHGLLTRLQNREYELVMENQRLAAELEDVSAKVAAQPSVTAAPAAARAKVHPDSARRLEELSHEYDALARENQSLKEEMKNRPVTVNPDLASAAVAQLKERCDELLEENGELAKLVKRLQEEMTALATHQSLGRRAQEDARESASAREKEMRRRLAEAETLVQEQAQQLVKLSDESKASQTAEARLREQEAMRHSVSEREGRRRLAEAESLAKEQAQKIVRLSEESRVAQRTEASLREELALAKASLAETQAQLSFAKNAIEGEGRKLGPAQEAARVLTTKLARLQAEHDNLETRLQEALSRSQASDLRLSEVIATHAAEMAKLRQESLILREAEEEAQHALLQVEERAAEAARRTAAALSQCENEIRVLKGEKSSLEAGLAAALSQLNEVRMESEALAREKDGLAAAVANKDMLLVKEQSCAAEAMILLAEMQEELDARKTAASMADPPSSPLALEREAVHSAVASSAQSAAEQFSPARGAALVESNRLLQDELSRARAHITSMAEAVRSAETRFQEQIDREREGSRAGVARLQSQLEHAQQALQRERQRVEQLQQQLSHAQSAAEQMQRRSQSMIQSAESGASAHSRQAQEERRLRLQHQSRAEQLETELEEERLRVATLQQAQTETMSLAHRSVGQALQKEQQTAKLLQEHNQTLQLRLRSEAERLQQMEHAVEAAEAEKLSMKEGRRRLEEKAEQMQEQNKQLLQQLQVTEGQRDEYAEALIAAMLELEQEQQQLLALKQSQQTLTAQLSALTEQLGSREGQTTLVDGTIDPPLAAELEKSQLTASVLQELVVNLEEQVEGLQMMLDERQQRASDSSASVEQALRQLQSSHSQALQELRAERALVRQQGEQAEQLSMALEQRTKQCQELSGQLQRAHGLLQKQHNSSSKREGSELEMAKLHIQGLESQLVSAAEQYRALEQDMQRLSSTLQGVPAEEHRRAQEMALKLEDAHREIKDLTAAADSARDAAARAIDARRQLEAAVAKLEQSLDEEKMAHQETTSLMESALISLALADEEQQQQQQTMVSQQPSEMEPVLRQGDRDEQLARVEVLSVAMESKSLKERLRTEQGEKSRLQEEAMQLKMRLDEYRELVTTQEGELSSLKGLLRDWKASDAVLSQSPVRECTSDSSDRGFPADEGDSRVFGSNPSSMWQRISLLESQLDRARAAEASAQERVREMLLSREHDLNRRESGSEETAHLRAEVKMLRQLLQESKLSAQKSRAGEESALGSLSLLQRTHDRDLDLLADAKVSLERERREHGQTKSLLEEAQQAAEEYAARTDRLRKALDNQRQAMANDATAHATLVRDLQVKLEAALGVKQELSHQQKHLSATLAQTKQQLASKEATLTAFQSAVQDESRSHQRIILDLEAAVRRLEKEKTEGLERLEEFELISGQLDELSSQYQATLANLQKDQEELELRCAQEVERRTMAEQQLASLQESSKEQQRRFGRLQEQLMRLQEGSGPSEGMKSVLQSAREQLTEEKEKLQKATGELDVQRSLRAKAEVQLQLARKTVETLQKTMARDSKSHQELVFSLQKNFASSSRAREEQGELITAAQEELKAERSRKAQVVRELALSQERCGRLVAELNSTSAALVDTQVRNEGLAAKLSDLKRMLTERERSLEESYAVSLAAEQSQREKLESELSVRKRDNEELLKTLRTLSTALVEFERVLRPVGEVEGQRSLVEENISAQMKKLNTSPPGRAPERLQQLVRLLLKRQSLSREELEGRLQDKERAVRELEKEIIALKETIRSKDLELSAMSRSSFAEREKQLLEEKKALEERISQLDESCQGDRALARKVEGAVIGEMDVLRSENLSLSAEKKAIEEEKIQLEGVVQELEEQVDSKEGQLETLRNQLLHQQQLLKLARLTILKEDEELGRRMEAEQEEIRQQKVELTELFRLSQRLIRLKEESEARCQLACQEYDELHELWLEEHEELLGLREDIYALQEEAALSDELNERITQLEKELEEKEVQLDLLRCVHEEEKTLLVEQLREDARLLRDEGM